METRDQREKGTLLNFFFFFFLAALGLRCGAWAFSSCGERGFLILVEFLIVTKELVHSILKCMIVVSNHYGI